MIMTLDPLYWLMLLPCMLIAIYAQILVKNRYAKFSRLPISSGLTGAEVAKYILENAGIHDVEIRPIAGELTDHYNPLNKTLNLSENIYYGNSIAAAGIAAHEVGHALQHHFGYKPLIIRNAIVPFANLGSQLAFPLIFIGLIFHAFALIKLAIIFFSFAVGFTIITLPVEFDASYRAVKILNNYHLLNEKELNGVKKVLTAAALTYVASALTAVMQLLYYIFLANRGDD